MADAEKSIVMISLDRDRPFRLDCNSLSDLESASGISMAMLPELAEKNGLGLDAIRKLVWAGLQPFDGSLRKDREKGINFVGELIQKKALGENFADRLTYCVGKIKEALALTFPPPQAEDQPADPTSPPAGTPGASSSPGGP